MARLDKARVAKRSVQKQEQSLDINPHKSTKKAKAKERQMGKKEIRRDSTELKELTDLSSELSEILLKLKS